ncbi:MAG: chondroitinase-B domain-containing protein [Opitutaceae bacterium]
MLAFLLLLPATQNVSGAPKQVEWTLPVALRLVEVNSGNQLRRAVKKARPGDHILLADGDYGSLSVIDKSGTPEAPIVIAAINPRSVIFSGSINGRNAKLSNASHIILSGLKFTQAQVWGLTIGPAYSDDSKMIGCQGIVIYNCEIDHAGQTLLKINGNSKDIAILASRFHHSGNLESSGRPYAEGVYIGEGATLLDRSHHIRVLGNHFYAIGNERNWGEAIDIKGQAYEVLIEGNLIESVIVDSGGAITALLDKVDYPEADANPRISIRENVIRGVRKRDGGWHGAGICVGANGIKVVGNHVSDTEGAALLALANAGNTEGELLLDANTFEGLVSLNLKWRGLRSSPLTVMNGDAVKGLLP